MFPQLDDLSMSRENPWPWIIQNEHTSPSLRARAASGLHSAQCGEGLL